MPEDCLIGFTYFESKDDGNIAIDATDRTASVRLFNETAAARDGHLETAQHALQVAANSKALQDADQSDGFDSFDDSEGSDFFV